MIFEAGMYLSYANKRGRVEARELNSVRGSPASCEIDGIEESMGATLTWSTVM